MTAATESPPNIPNRIEFPSPDQIPEFEENPTVPPPLIEEPQNPTPPRPDEGDIDEEPREEPLTHGDEGSP